MLAMIDNFICISSVLGYCDGTGLAGSSTVLVVGSVLPLNNSSGDGNAFVDDVAGVFRVPGVY